MMKHYLPILPQSFDTYVEPFFGGGAMFIHQKTMNPNLKCYINDINPNIVNIYKAIKYNVEDFLIVLDSLDKAYIPLSKEKRKEFYYGVRKDHAWDYHTWGMVHEAATFYFLLKTCFNGILQININTNNRFGTPAGLLNEKTSVYSKENVLLWNKALQDCEITSLDWKDAIKDIKKDNTFFFFDPPYRGCFTSYGQTFTDDDQIELLDFCKDIPNGYVMLCNRDDADGFWNGKEGNLGVKKIDVTYTAGRRKRDNGNFLAKPATEVLFYTKPKSLFDFPL
jgi:DNA adenine methylase